jgi:hypothetical protein
MSDRWIRGHFGDEVRTRPGFLGELEHELGLAWPAPSIEPEPERAPSGVPSIDESAAATLTDLSGLPTLTTVWCPVSMNLDSREVSLA